MKASASTNARRNAKAITAANAVMAASGRVIPLPEGAITDQAKATFTNGVLEITMPAPPTSKGRRLEVTEGEVPKK